MNPTGGPPDPFKADEPLELAYEPQAQTEQPPAAEPALVPQPSVAGAAFVRALQTLLIIVLFLAVGAGGLILVGRFAPASLPAAVLRLPGIGPPSEAGSGGAGGPGRPQDAHPAEPSHRGLTADADTPRSGGRTLYAPTGDPIPGIVYVDSRPPGAKVRIGGREVGQTPYMMQRRADAGPFELELRLKGYRPWRQTVEGTEEGVRVEARLRKLPPGPG